ncbi:MAG: DUF1987 domain-containing protein [Betaproteobacteria bacterium]|nr:DUF1987 domain-containing protein [Betaproteobacteria bacterium]
MNDFHIARTAHTPEVDFRFSEHRLTLCGEAYPEDAASFFNPVLSVLERYLATVDDCNIEFNFQLTYFNSASTKMLYRLFGLLNDSACTRNRVVMRWHHDPEDDTVLEFGESVHDDFNALEFIPTAIPLAAL